MCVCLLVCGGTRFLPALLPGVLSRSPRCVPSLRRFVLGPSTHLPAAIGVFSRAVHSFRARLIEKGAYVQREPARGSPSDELGVEVPLATQSSS